MALNGKARRPCFNPEPGSRPYGGISVEFISSHSQKQIRDREVRSQVMRRFWRLKKSIIKSKSVKPALAAIVARPQQPKDSDSPPDFIAPFSRPRSRNFPAEKRAKAMAHSASIQHSRNISSILTVKHCECHLNRDGLVDWHMPTCSLAIPVGYRVRLMQANSDPMSVLGAGRVDPFASYPRSLSKDEFFMLDHCKNTLEIILHEHELYGFAKAGQTLAIMLL